MVAPSKGEKTSRTGGAGHGNENPVVERKKTATKDRPKGGVTGQEEEKRVPVPKGE